MKKSISIGLAWLVSCLSLAGHVAAEDLSNAALNERIKKLEAQNGDWWANRITFSGIIEAKAGFTSEDYDDSAEEDADTSDLVLATVAIGIEAEVHKHVGGHILLLWEEDDTDPIDIDEGYITIDGKAKLPLYLNAGKLYVPFGNFKSHMITDPLTLDLGETNHSALQIGFANDFLDADIAFFNGDVDETGEDDTIGSFAARVEFRPPEGTIANLTLSAGASFISNIADTDTMSDVINTPDETVASHIPGMGAFISVSFKEFLFLEVEYIMALDEFNDNELSFSDGDALAPSAFNIELAVAPLDDIVIALRYARTNDVKGGIADAFLPESQAGVTLSYGLLDDISLGIEYLNNTYENEDRASVITTQLAIEF